MNREWSSLQPLPHTLHPTSWTLYVSPTASTDITPNQGPGSKRNVFFHSPGSCKSKVRVWAGPCWAGSRESWVCVWLTSSSLHPAPPAPPAPSYSVAKCLGAKTVAARALACTQELQILSEVVEDSEAVTAVQRFLGE